jgi:hypothetical protein
MKRKRIPAGVVILSIGAIVLATSLVINYLQDVGREEGAGVNGRIAQTPTDLGDKSRPAPNLTGAERETDSMSGSTPDREDGPLGEATGGMISPEEPSSPFALHLVIPDLGIDTLVSSIGVVPSENEDLQSESTDKTYDAGEGQSEIGRYFAGSVVDSTFAPGSENYDLIRNLIGLENDVQIIVYDLSQAQFAAFNEQSLIPVHGKPLELKLDGANWVIPGLDDQATIIACWQCGKDSVNVLYVALP